MLDMQCGKVERRLDEKPQCADMQSPEVAVQAASKSALLQAPRRAPRWLPAVCQCA